MRAILPPSLVMTLLADRGGCRTSTCFAICRSFNGTDLLRRPCDTLVHLEASSISAVKDLCPPAGEQRFYQQVSILGAAVGPVSLALACLLEQLDDRLYRGKF